MDHKKTLTPEELRERAIRFYSRYGDEIENIKDLLEIKLKQLALAYTIENKLPREAIIVRARTKSLKSFLKKLEKKNWPQFYYPTEVVSDLIGARVICWFIDDCNGIKQCIEQSNLIKIVPSGTEDYIAKPKDSGYRSLHLLANVPYDSVTRIENKVILTVNDILCEIQIRTKLQDAWGDITHEFHYKAKNLGVEDKSYESLLADIAERLSIEDRTLIKFRNAYQQLADDKLKSGQRQGFQDDKT
jgi:putative GTP pyrophosphokinase